MKWEQANKHGNLKIRIPAIFQIIFSVVFGTHSTSGVIQAFLKQNRSLTFTEGAGFLVFATKMPEILSLNTKLKMVVFYSCLDSIISGHITGNKQP